jgi:hypothetical protein
MVRRQSLSEATSTRPASFRGTTTPGRGAATIAVRGGSNGDGERAEESCGYRLSSRRRDSSASVLTIVATLTISEMWLV